MSDGCSSVLGLWMERTWPQALDVCRAHDADYERGGTEVDRLIADLTFFIGLLTRGLPPLVCQQAFNAVRLGGRSHFRHEGPEIDVEVPAVVEIPQTA